MAQSIRFDPATVALMLGPLTELAASEDHTGRLLMRLFGTMHRFEVQLLPALGLAPSDLSALLLLWDGGRMSQTELGKRVRLSRATMTSLVTRCERDGWIARTADLNDRRRVMLTVTPKFDAALLDAAHVLVTELAPTEDDRTTIAGVAERLRAAMPEAARILSERPGKRPRRSPEPAAAPPEPDMW